MRKALFLVVVLGLVAAGSAAAQSLPAGAGKAAALKPKPALGIATFAGGCFWCMQPPFDKTRGVVSTVVGYTGGAEKNPTYEQVSSSRTGHREAIQVKFDPAVVTYDELLDVFWRSIDPTQGNGQFADIGPQYRPGIFYHSEEQKRLSEASKQKLVQSGKFSRPIAVQLLPASAFYAAEEYHQKYYLKHPDEYLRYAVGSGRYPFLERTWGIKH